MSETPEPPKRRPQFKRVKRGNIRLTRDDITAIQYVADYGYRPCNDICNQLPHRSAKKFSERLRDLYDNDYLDRPVAQRNDHLIHGKKPLIYALGNKGAELLAELHGYIPPRSDWTKKNRLVKRPYIQHRLRVGDIQERVDKLPHHYPDIAIITATDILSTAPKLTQETQKPWLWTAHVRNADGSIKPKSVTPDNVFGLDHTTQRQRYYFFAEADRRTEPVVRGQEANSSVGRKFEAYLAGFHANLHTTRYGIGNLRFLIVTTSEERIETMTTALQAIADTLDCSMFFFTTAAALARAEHILCAPWQNAQGVASPLIPNLNLQEQTTMTVPSD